MNAPHPSVELWQPSYLHELDKLAQAAADSALAALDPQGEAAVVGIRFIGAYKKLYKQLAPFRQHDPDRPGTWPPQADPGLLFALLRLLSVLEKLEPPAEVAPWGRRRKKQLWFDGGEAASSLKEQRPTVERLHKTADEVHQLVNSLLARTIPQPTRAPVSAESQGQEPRANSNHAPGVRRRAEQAEPSLAQKAIALIAANPDWPIGRYAEALRCHRSALYRSPVIKAALDARRGSKRDLPRGFKDQEGDFDAWGEDE